ncbi:MAG TPA: hypothetical protein V6D20_22610, partial [Candidatus Obscuribacterales bacterium]
MSESKSSSSDKVKKTSTKASTSRATKTAPSDRMALATAVASITKKGDDWVAALETFKQLREGIIQNLETEISTKQREQEEAQSAFEQTKRSRQIEMDQDLSEYGYQQALKILAARQEVPIESAKLAELKEQYATLKAKDDSELKNAVEEERKSSARAFTFEKRALQLQHEKEVAQLTAQNQALLTAVESLKEDVEKAQARLDAAQALTRHVAEAAKAPPIVQNMGK